MPQTKTSAHTLVSDIENERKEHNYVKICQYSVLHVKLRHLYHTY